MRSIDEYKHAGQVPFQKWAEEKDIELPVFDIDGTITHFNQDEFVDEVVNELAAQKLSKLYRAIALGSNNQNPVRVNNLAKRLEDILQIDVYAVCAGDGYRRKPNTEMGKKIADHFHLKPENLGVVGDRAISDVIFALVLGAGAIALTEKAGDGDDKWVPTVRIAERGFVKAHKLIVAVHDRLLVPPSADMTDQEI